MAGPRFATLRVAGVERLTGDAVAVAFDVPEALREAYDFAAGQSLTLRRTVDGVEERRSYSICAPAGAPPRVGVREIPGGLFSSWLVRDVRPGDEVEVGTPTGQLRADPAVPGWHVLVAAGSGITPMISIATTVLTHPDARVTLVYGNRTTGSVMFAEELADLKDRHGHRFELVHVLSREARPAELLSGRLDADRLRRLFATLVPVERADHVWLCGPLGMVTGAREVLDDLGVLRSRVRAELFHVEGADAPPPVERRTDEAEGGATCRVTALLDGRETVAAVPHGATVLDGLAAARPDVPFACKGGVCGTCRAHVATGEVEMRRNHALDDDEVARGFVLTCQAVPVTDEVTVDFDA